MIIMLYRKLCMRRDSSKSVTFSISHTQLAGSEIFSNKQDQSQARTSSEDALAAAFHLQLEPLKGSMFAHLAGCWPLAPPLISQVKSPNCCVQRCCLFIVLPLLEADCSSFESATGLIWTFSLRVAAPLNLIDFEAPFAKKKNKKSSGERTSAAAVCP